ncbi:hypothetical protein QZH41_015777, partial [Actinostola sp. cb2023]
MLARKLHNIKTAKIELSNAKTNKENFQRELTTALNHNSGSLSICGKCHLKIGHNRHVCDGEQCTSAMLCGIIDKHPDDKAKLRSLSQKKVEKSKAEITKLEIDYDNKLKAYKGVEDSFAKKIEQDIIYSDPDKYVVRGIKNWALLSKHVALLQNKCSGKLPPRNCDGKNSNLKFKMAAEYCCVPLCTSDKRKEKDLAFHHFPKDKQLKVQWLYKIRHDEGKYFKVTQASYVCARHFRSSDYKWTPNRKCLVPGAVPSVFAWTQQDETQQGRKAPKRRIVESDKYGNKLLCFIVR